MSGRALTTWILGAALTLLSAPAATAQDAPGIDAGYERTRDRFHYRFENPSNFDTVELVPHEFTQTYWGDNQWFSVRAKFRGWSRMFETEAAVTPQRSTRGDDFDTFFQPSGDVVVLGTTGGVSMRSWRIREKVGAGRKAGIDWYVAYQYRSDRMDFHPGLKSISHTRPPSYEAFVVTTRETTTTRNYGAEVWLARTWRPSRWRVTLEAAAAPVTNGRLSIVLPDKYPGQTLVFNAVYASVEPQLTVSKGERTPVWVAVRYNRTFNYVDSRQFVRNAVGIALGAGWRGTGSRRPQP
jgi:hypothetical protein